MSRAAVAHAPTRATGATRGTWIQRDASARRRWPRVPATAVTDKTRLDWYSLSARRTLRLCDALMVPLDILDLRACFATGHAVRVLSKVVVDVWGPAKPFETEGGIMCSWDSAARGLFVHDHDNSGKEDNSDDDGEEDSYTSGDEEIDADEEEDDSEMEED